MTSVKFIYCKDMMVGFKVSGHSTADENDDYGRLVCSAISSAVYLSANTLTDVLLIKCNIKESDGEFELLVLEKEEQAQTTLKGFKLHIEGLRKENKSYIKVSTEEK